MTDKNQMDALKALDAMQGSQPRQPEPKKPTANREADRKPKQPKTAKARQEGPVESPFSGSGIGRIIGKTLRGDLLASSIVRRQIGLIMLLGLFGIIMVFMRYQVESLQKEKLSTLKRIDYLNEHRIEISKQYQQAVMPSTIAEALQEEGIGTMSGPPFEL